MKFEETVYIDALPAKVYAAYRKVSSWPEWDPEVEFATLRDFSVGSKGHIKPKGAPKSKIKIIEATQNKSFTIECKLPLCKMHFKHVLHPTKDGTNVYNSVVFSGLFAPIFGRLIGQGISKTLPDSLRGLKNHLESR